MPKSSQLGQKFSVLAVPDDGRAFSFDQPQSRVPRMATGPARRRLKTYPLSGLTIMLLPPVGLLGKRLVGVGEWGECRWEADTRNRAIISTQDWLLSALVRVHFSSRGLI